MANKTKLAEAWNKSQVETISYIYEAISVPSKYVELKVNHTDGEIRKVVGAILEVLKKDKGKDVKTYNNNTYNQAIKITKYFADLIKKESQSMLVNNKGQTNLNAVNSSNINNHNNVILEQRENDNSNMNINQKNNNIETTATPNTNERSDSNNNKRKNDDDVNDIQIDNEILSEIIDVDNINPTKRKRIISKTYIKDDNELPPGWHIIQNNNARPVVNIRPKDNSDINKFKNIVEETLDNEEDDYGNIDHITKGSKVITVHFDDIKNRDLFIKYLKNKQKSWEYDIPKLRNPCVRINGVIIRGTNETDKVDWEKWTKKILNKNKWIPQTHDSIFKVVFSVAKKGKWNVVIEVTPNIRQAIVRKQGKIFSGLNKYEVYDNFNITTCYNCSTYGHTTNQCGQQPVCNYCSKQHHNTCPIINQKDKYKCPACHKNGHSFNDPTCNEFMWRLQHELQFINMNYDVIMTPKK